MSRELFEEEPGGEPERPRGTRETSAQAYATIRDNGLLSRIRWVAYDALYRHGPCTARELRQRAGGDPGAADFTDSYHKRLSELRDLGVAREVEERKCTVTGQQAIVWDVTAGLPEKKAEEPEGVSAEYRRGFQDCRERAVEILRRTATMFDAPGIEEIKALTPDGKPS